MKKITNEIMLDITANMPMKLISIEKKETHINKVPASKTADKFQLRGIVGTEYVVWQEPYLERYYAGTFRDGSDLWLHHFLSDDSDRYVHCHPFNFESVMLCGAYNEEYLKDNGEKDFRISLPLMWDTANNFYTWNVSEVKRTCKSASESLEPPIMNGRKISVFDWHRIAAVEKDTWTMLLVQPKRLPFWFFKDDNGDTKPMKASPKEWWHDFKTRSEQGF